MITTERAELNNFALKIVQWFRLPWLQARAAAGNAIAAMAAGTETDPLAPPPGYRAHMRHWIANRFIVNQRASASAMEAILGTPDFPTKLTVTADGSTAADLAWTPQDIVATQRVEASLTRRGGWETVASLAAGVSTYKATGLGYGRWHYFRVVAVNAYGDSGPSNVDSDYLPTPATVLSKTSDCEGCEDAHARSRQEIVSGDGYAQFVVKDTVDQAVFILQNTAAETFHWSIVGGLASVYVNDVYAADTAIVVNDVLRVSVDDGKVSFQKNGVTVHTSVEEPELPMYLNVYLLSNDAIIHHAEFAAPPDNPEYVYWQGLVNVVAT